VKSIIAIALEAREELTRERCKTENQVRSKESLVVR
jgi:hypothetical protein